MTAGDHADDPWRRRQRTLPRRVEQTFLGELMLQALERLEQGAAADRADAIDDELEPAARGPDRRSTEHLDLGAVREVAPDAERRVAVRHAVNHRVLGLVLQGEVGVTAGREPERTHLALDPLSAGGLLHRPPEAAVELRDANHDLLGHFGAAYSKAGAGFRPGLVRA